MMEIEKKGFGQLAVNKTVAAAATVRPASMKIVL